MWEGAKKGSDGLAVHRAKMGFSVLDPDRHHDLVSVVIDRHAAAVFDAGVFENKRLGDLRNREIAVEE